MTVNILANWGSLSHMIWLSSGKLDKLMITKHKEHRGYKLVEVA